eukprot:GILJ01012072.1.p3 GENE.GILJ01012072.1~~GILJ01012072.1.p3  ORF type:complete len:153 (+),score=16.41 GILJ01012072.1:432-890(+)
MVTEKMQDRQQEEWDKEPASNPLKPLTDGRAQPIHMTFAPKRLAAFRTQLRTGVGPFNNSMCIRRIIDNPRCSCDQGKEDRTQIILHCPKYTDERNTMNQHLTELEVEPTENITMGKRPDNVANKGKEVFDVTNTCLAAVMAKQLSPDHENR